MRVPPFEAGMTAVAKYVGAQLIPAEFRRIGRIGLDAFLDALPPEIAAAVRQAEKDISDASTS